MTAIQLYNTLTRRKEAFEPLKAPHVGMYVCGPTVYGDAHLGHARPAITFDIVFRYLTHIGYKVRYVRNITDVGHLENDADQGEDKIAKKARLEQLEPMEVVQYYTDRYHRNMDDLNVLSPSIEPRASGHIIEQIKMIQDIIDNGFAYAANGSVYFDVLKYNASHHYGKLSGRIVEDLLANTRDLDGQGEKRNSLDFALWKKALPMHIMRWPSPWSDGFPGWHIECSAMSSKYLGEVFDIHGGGMDLMFPHHECEIAQSQASHKHDPAKYWMHNNMITINGQKMGKSLGNFITLDQLFAGEHPLLEKAYSPMTIRFFILQSQYRSTLDFSNDALSAAEKGYRKVMNGLRTLNSLQHTAEVINQVLSQEVITACDGCGEGLNDDFNTAVTLAAIFNLLKYINSFKGGQLQLSSITEEAFSKLKNTYNTYVTDILGLKEETGNALQTRDSLMELIMQNYTEAKTRKDYAAVDKIRADLKGQGILIKDSKTISEWTLEE